MAYRNVDISGQSGYWASLGRKISYTYRFVIEESYDAAQNTSTLRLAGAQLWVDLNDNVGIWGVVRLNGVTVGTYSGAGITTQHGAFTPFGGAGGAVTVAHDAYGNAPAVTVSFAQAPGTPNWVGSNFGFSRASGVVVGFGIGTTSSYSVSPHARASSIASIPSAVGTQETLNLTVARNAGTFWHKAAFRTGGTTLATSDAFETALNYPIPRSWFSAYPNAASLLLTVSVQTYTDAGCTTAVGDPAAASVTLSADAGMKPRLGAGWVSLAPYNTGAAASITGYVKGYSEAEARFDAAKIDMRDAVGASIASCSVSCLGRTVSASPYRTGILSALSVPVVCTVTDTRGRTASETLTLAVMDYAAPVLTEVSVFRSGAQGAADEEGAYFEVTAAAAVSSLGSQNTLALSCAIMAAGGSYGPETALASGVRKHLPESGTISPDRSYTVRVTATDALGSTAVFYQAIPTRKWALKFRANGSGAAFGKAAETDGLFDVSWDARFRGGLRTDGDAAVGGDLTVTGDIVGLFDRIYPVGSIFLSVRSTDPGSLFGGTWVRIKDRFLLAAGDVYAAGATGGEAAHTLTLGEMPAHRHVETYHNGGAGEETELYGGVRLRESWASGFQTQETGGGLAHNNMPPYLAVYVWKRTQ